MIKSYLRTAWRNLSQNKSTSFISVAGLAVGICCFLLLATYIINELRYDSFNTNAGRIVRLVYNAKSPDDKDVRSLAISQTAPVPVFKQQFTEIEDGARLFRFGGDKGATVKYQDKLFSEHNILLADASFFKIFTFKFIKGDVTALNDPSSVVISRSAAKKYFGDDEAIGKMLVINQTNLMISGVIEDVPAYSQIKFDIMANSALKASSKDLIWNSANNYSYFMLKPGVNLKALSAKMNAYVDKIFKDENRGSIKSWYTLEPLKSVHLYSTAQSGLEPGGSITNIYILGFVAMVLLTLACVNFLNLVTARSAERAREIGVRKVMGAQRSQLFFQFITEAGIITLCSLIAGIGLLALSYDWFSNFTGQQLGFNTWKLSWMVGAMAVLFVLVTFLAGTYPSLYLSAFKPVVTLKGGSAGKAGGNAVRKSLVVFQFVVSVFFIISTLIAGNQLRYLQTVNTGINRDQVLVLDMGGMGYDKMVAFKNEIQQQTGVHSATASYDSPVSVGGGYSINSAEGKNADFELSVTAIPIEKSFVKTLGIKLVAGRDLERSDEQQVLQPDSLRTYSFILNENAIKQMGWNPEEAIGKHINLNGRKGIIKAVARDFNFASLHQEITPIVMFPEYDWFAKILVKTSGKQTAKTVAAIQNKWKQFYPDMPFAYHFLDEEYDALYKTDQRTGNILTAFTLVTIFISCLGLFGLAVFTTRQRVKEIGIRKVLGANVASIVGLISADFLKLVLIAVVISSPLAFYAMRSWLQDFAYRVNIGWEVFALAGGMACIIAFVTVGYQSIKAALANPVKSLRSE